MKIHPTAQVSPNSNLADDVEVGPYSIIEENVNIDSKTQIGTFCVIKGFTSIGKRCKIFTGAVIGSIPQDLKYKEEKTSIIIGDENIIREYVTINLGTGKDGKTKIGNKNLIMAYAHIAHDCDIHNDVIIANAGTLAGHVLIEDMAIIGGLVAIHQFARVGRLSIIGGCSKVVQDIPPFSICDGHPTKVYGINSIGLRRAGFFEASRNNLKGAFRLLFNSELSISSAISEIKNRFPTDPDISYLINFIKSSKRGICR